jgi:hypothetical protein
MSEADPKAQAKDSPASIVSPIMLNGKGSAAAPKLSADDGNVEMKNMSSEPGAQLDEDIMQLARTGNIPAIQKLFDAQKFHPTYCDTEGITSLHVYTPGIH